MTTLYENPHTGGFLLSHDDTGNLSLDNITVASGAGVLQPGTVLGKVTASGKFVQFDHTAADGSQLAAGVLFDRVDATLADAKAINVARHAEVRASALIWKVTELAANQAAALATLAAASLIGR